MGISLRPNETREMRLLSKLIRLTRSNTARGDVSLPDFIARRRAPGDGWRSWDEIRYELREVSGEIVTDGTLRKWAQRYGIPEDTQADGEAGTSAEAFADALAQSGVEQRG